MLMRDIVKVFIKKCLNFSLRHFTSKINVLLTNIYCKYDSDILSSTVLYFFNEQLKQNFTYHCNQ